MQKRLVGSLLRLSLVATTLSCGHSQPVQPPPAAATSRVTDPTPAQAEPSASTAEPSSSTPGKSQLAQKVSITAFMHDHFMIAVYARDAVIDGDLRAASEPLQTLADYAYKEVVPGGWMRGIAQLQAAARLTASAKNVTAAAAGVAVMARVCGECHTAQGHKLELADERVEIETPKSDLMPERMFRHAWAAERLWEGLMAPSDQTWRAGAAALAHAPVIAPKPRTTASKDYKSPLPALREPGPRAGYAKGAQERADVYALILSTCAVCHAATPSDE